MTRNFVACASMIFAVVIGASVSAPAYAQNAAAPTSTSSDVPAVPHPWSSLDATQRDMLAPLQPTWDTLSPRRQAHMLQRAEHWVTLPAAKREKIREHIAHWQQMTPEQREQARDNRRKFDQLSPAQREQLHATYEHFQQLPAAQRDQLMREWHALPPQQRLQWSKHHQQPAPSPDHDTSPASDNVPADPTQP